MARIGEILDRKGTGVVTIGPDASLHEVLAALEEHSIGALVVSGDGRALEGIISERDVVRVLARSGAGALDQPVSDVMTREVTTCSREQTADDVMATMTEHRFRHIPVVVDGGLGGIISIGDVVKSRMDELEYERGQLEQYVTGTSY